MILKETNELFAAGLRDPAYAAGYLNIALEEDGVEGFLYAPQKVARVLDSLGLSLTPSFSSSL